jgi:ankyrin repeat protein
MKWLPCLSHIVTNDDVLPQMMTFLMDRAHAMLECRNKNLETPLLLACRKGHLNALKLLRERGARADAMDKYVYTSYR